MRQRLFSLLAALCLLAAPGLSRAAGQNDIPSSADVKEYIRLFGYRQMLEAGAERQLANIIGLVRQTRENVPPGALELIHEELRAELRTAAEASAGEMVAVFQRHFSREDIAYLLGVGRDARMQRVIALQPKIAEDMESVGERLAEDIAAKAAPRIEARLRSLALGQEL